MNKNENIADLPSLASYYNRTERHCILNKNKLNQAYEVSVENLSFKVYNTFTLFGTKSKFTVTYYPEDTEENRKALLKRKKELEEA